MTADPLDDLLDRSVPTPSSVPQADFEVMITEARELVPRSRRAPALIAAGSVVFLLAGGTGVAAATDGFRWSPWAQDPIGAVPFTMENGFDCELRLSEYKPGTKPGYPDTDPAFVDKVNRILEDWYRSADVVAAAREFVPTALDEYGPIALQPGETVDTLPPGEAEHRAWLREWVAWDQAISEAEAHELANSGIEPGDARLGGSERSGQIQCFDADHQLYVPGAGS